MEIAGEWRKPWFVDAKRINRALFGVYFEEDIYESFCDRFPAAMRAFRWRIARRMRMRNLIFIHVPRVAGTSIAQALYGPRHGAHLSARYYRTLDPDFFAAADSFALLRDPFDRFASAYAFVRGKGTARCPLARVFADATDHVRSVDDYLSFLEGREALALDFVMRPQSWFVCDLQSGVPLVRNLFLYGDDGLGPYLRRHGVTQLPWLNAVERLPLFLSRRQRSRIEQLYATDFALIEGLRRQRDSEQFAGVAAE